MKQGSGLHKKRVVILGGSSGIGFAVVQLAASQGTTVVIASSNAERVQKAIGSLSGHAKGHTADLSGERAVETLFGSFGAFDHLVFPAGDSFHLENLANTDLQQARRAFELRYWAALAAVKYASKSIRKRGSTVLATGVAGRHPHKGCADAASFCGTIEASTRALALELGRYA